MDSVERKVQKIVKEDANRVANLTREAAVSKAYLYPIKGIFFFLSHRSLWKPLQHRLAPLLGVSLTTLAGLFLVAYVPQAAALAFVEGPVAPVSAAMLVLSESSTLAQAISRRFVISDALVDTFDGTLVARGVTDIVSQGRQIRSGHDPISRLGKLVKQPFEKYSPSALIRYFLYLPLNLIPLVGTVLFIVLQGQRAGPTAHSRYFQLKQMNSSMSSQWVQERKGAYTAFGVVASALEMVPVVGVGFSFTNAVGAALWAADLEGAGKGKMKAEAGIEERVAVEKEEGKRR